MRADDAEAWTRKYAVRVNGRPDHDRAEDGFETRRTVIRRGVKLAFVAPVLSTFFATNAYAARYSCYPVGHVCADVDEGPGGEPCCGTPCPEGGGACPP